MENNLTEKNSSPAEQVIDMHLHVGLRGDTWPQWGRFSDDYLNDPAFQVFLKYGRLSREDVTDHKLREKTLAVIRESKIDKVVCLALDPIYDSQTGERRQDLSHMWVSNEFITESLQPELPEKILLGASVHPYDLQFEQRVSEVIAKGAVLLKWLPSAQQINLADERVEQAMKFLATANQGKPLPLLLHVGTEMAIPPHDQSVKSYDFLTWSWKDSLWNFFRRNRWHKPQVKRIEANFKTALDTGAVIIFAHCGAPYLSGGLLGGLAEHSDFKTVSRHLKRTERGEFKGRCYADISAFVVHTRRPYFNKVRKLPQNLILFGSDFPVPIIRLSTGPEDWWKSFKKAVKEGKVDPLFVPEGNLLDVNYDELRHVFGNHPMFTNFNRLISKPGE